ncbi:MAG: inner membrane protein [Rhodospirillaceae bacterium]|nr:inner membrane protein [Rhodospirillaceae bacterium]
MEYLAGIQFWYWWILAAVLAGIEALAPGMFFIWFGLAAALVGFASAVFPGLGWQWQGVLFAVLAVATVVLVRLYLHRHPTATDDPALNRRGERYLGRLFLLETPIINGRGSIKVDDSIWRAAGPDLPLGRRVKVVGIEGSILKVEAAD